MSLTFSFPSSETTKASLQLRVLSEDTPRTLYAEKGGAGLKASEAVSVILEVTPGTTVGAVKHLIEDKIGIPQSHQELALQDSMGSLYTSDVSKVLNGRVPETVTELFCKVRCPASFKVASEAAPVCVFWKGDKCSFVEQHMKKLIVRV